MRYEVVEEEEGGSLSETAEILYALGDDDGRLTSRELAALRSLTRLLGQTLKQTEALDESSSKRIAETIDGAEEALAGQSRDYDLTPDEGSKVHRACRNLRDLTRAGRCLPKEDRAFKWISHAIENDHDVCMVVANGSSLITAQAYWREELERDGYPSERLRVVTPSKLLKQKVTSDKEEVIVTGWFGREEMQRLLHSGLSSIYTIMLYRGTGDVPLELDWYNRANERWNSEAVRVASRSNSSLSKTGITVQPVQGSTVRYRRSGQGETGREATIADLAQKLDIDLFAARDGAGTRETCIATPVWFTSGAYRCLVTTKRGGDTLVTIIDDLPYGVSWCRKGAKTLQEGDLVLRTEADDEALSEACRAFGSGEEALATARSWHGLIDEALRQTSAAEVRRKIVDAGCKRIDATINRWIGDSSIIAPDAREDIEAIGRALGHPYSPEELDRIMSAASICRGDRIGNGKKICRKIADAFVDDARECGSIERALDGFKRRHGELGEVELYCVEHIGELREMPASRLGWRSE